jgi:hypothetical protein
MKICGGSIEVWLHAFLTSARMKVTRLVHVLPPYVVVEWLTLLQIREVPGSNFGLETEVFVVFLSPSRQIPGWYPKLGHDRFLFHPLQFTIHLSSFHSTPYNLSYRESVVK